MSFYAPIIGFLSACIALSVRANSLSSLVSRSANIGSLGQSIADQIRTITHDATTLGVSLPVNLHILRQLSLLSRIGNVLSNRLSRATYLLPDYNDEVDLLSTSAAATIDDLVPYLEWIGQRVESIESKASAISSEVGGLSVYMQSMLSLVQLLDYSKSMLRYATNEDGFSVRLVEDQMEQFGKIGDNIIDRLDKLEKVLVDAIEGGDSIYGNSPSGGPSMYDVLAGVSSDTDDMTRSIDKINAHLDSIGGTILQWYNKYVYLHDNLYYPLGGLFQSFFVNWRNSQDWDNETAIELRAQNQPVVRAWLLNPPDAATNNLPHTERFYKENADELDTIATILGGEDSPNLYSSFGSDGQLRYVKWDLSDPGFMTFTNRNPILADERVGGRNGLEKMIEMMWQACQISAWNSITLNEIRKLMVGTDSDIAEDTYVDGLTDLENQYGDEDGWMSHFDVVSNTLSGVSAKLTVNGDSVVDRVFGGIGDAGSSPSVIAFNLPSVTIGDVSIETMPVVAELPDSVVLYLDSIRNVVIFGWWTLSAAFCWAMARSFLWLVKVGIIDRFSSVQTK